MWGHKHMKKRRPVDEPIWKLFVIACGSRCVNCLRPDESLQRGHIQSHKDDGPDHFNNLMPLCAKCNGKNNNTFTMGDLRPLGWVDTFIKLLAQSLGARTLVTGGPSVPTGSTGTNPSDSKRVVTWNDITFERVNEPITPLP